MELAFSLIKRRVREEHPENLKDLKEFIFNACKSINYIQSRNLIRHSLKILRYALNNENIRKPVISSRFSSLHLVDYIVNDILRHFTQMNRMS